MKTSSGITWLLVLSLKHKGTVLFSGSCFPGLDALKNKEYIHCNHTSQLGSRCEQSWRFSWSPTPRTRVYSMRGNRNSLICEGWTGTEVDWNDSQPKKKWTSSPDPSNTRLYVFSFQFALCLVWESRGKQRQTREERGAKKPTPPLCWEGPPEVGSRRPARPCLPSPDREPQQLLMSLSPPRCWVFFFQLMGTRPSEKLEHHFRLWSPISWSGLPEAPCLIEWL